DGDNSIEVGVDAALNIGGEVGRGKRFDVGNFQIEILTSIDQPVIGKFVKCAVINFANVGNQASGVDTFLLRHHGRKCTCDHCQHDSQGQQFSEHLVKPPHGWSLMKMLTYTADHTASGLICKRPHCQKSDHAF